MENASIALEHLLGTYNRQIQSQLDSVVRDYNVVSRNVLNIVKTHHETVFHDFVHRNNTGAIPADPANFYACLAGSIITCGSARVIDGSACLIKAELVGSSSNVLIEMNNVSCSNPG